ncbi:MAG: MBL fold metallo-hydrolase [Chloroflexi bacterium]|nr:MBL fold metallo-hydrolase [Chloroflexota bacterium]
MDTNLIFMGAAETVTGSRYLLRVGERRYLIDCGLFQGGRQLKDLNWQPFPIPPDQIDAILLTHAHIDHVGYLPRLVSQGFHGPVYATDATCALLQLVLPDSAHLQEQDAASANKKGYSRHRPARPLYSMGDAESALGLLQPVRFFDPVALDGVTVTWQPAGHILGSASLVVNMGAQQIVFSGDLGRYHSRVMKPPAAIAEADVLVVESTYGDRLHADEDVETVLQTALAHVLEHRGVLLIPAFAVGRTQQVLYHLRQLQNAGRIPSDLPVFIDSPMAVDASHLYCRFGDDHNLDINLLMTESDCPLRCRDTRFVRDAEESKHLNTLSGPAVIISASGMLTGGRILHHLKWRLPGGNNAVLFVGYQAEGTRGRLLLEGAKAIRIHGETVPVKARIIQAHALSGHADRAEILHWLSGSSRAPRRVFITHGEPRASQALAAAIHTELGWETEVPLMNDTFSFA